MEKYTEESNSRGSLLVIPKNLRDRKKKKVNFENRAKQNSAIFLKYPIRNINQKQRIKNEKVGE